jgi:hypothetical protein
LLLGRMGVAFIERRLSLLVLSYLKIVNSWLESCDHELVQLRSRIHKV